MEGVLRDLEREAELLDVASPAADMARHYYEHRQVNRALCIMEST